jgi:drug/metabolite transporter (DMT)-like permease
MVFAIGIAAALLLGIGYVLQQRVAATAPLSDMLRFQLLFHLMHRRLWWLGIGSMVIGQVLSGLALQLASVDLVEPLLSTNLLFALALAALLAKHRPRRTEIGGALLLSAALGVFLGVGHPRSGDALNPDAPTVWFGVVAVAGVVAACVAMGRRRSLVGESIWLATGAGLLYGLQDTATRAALVERDNHGLLLVFLHGWVYVLLGSAVIGILLSQSAFKAARLDWSLPPITAAEPITGIALGVTLLGDRISVSPLGLAVESACIVAVVFGVVMIGRSPSWSAACTSTRAAAQEQVAVSGS